MPAKINIVGRKFGINIVLKDAPGTVTAGGKKIRQVEIQCTLCQRIRTVRNIGLLSGKWDSCQCQRANNIATHGHARRSGKSKTYYCWRNMIARCTDPKNKRYNRYGGRGIKVCQRWLEPTEGFSNFLADMGEAPPGKTLDRYPDNDGDYTIENVRWATWLEQNQHRSRDLNFTVRGINGSLMLLCRHFNCSYSAALRRFHKGWTPEDAIFIPSGVRESRNRKLMSMR